MTCLKHCRNISERTNKKVSEVCMIHFSCVNSMCICWYAYACVALLIQHATILSCAASLPASHFSTLSHKQHDFR